MVWESAAQRVSAQIQQTMEILWKAPDKTGILERQHYILDTLSHYVVCKILKIALSPSKISIAWEGQRESGINSQLRKYFPEWFCLAMVWAELLALCHVVEGAKLCCWAAFVLNCATDTTFHGEDVVCSQITAQGIPRSHSFYGCTRRRTHPLDVGALFRILKIKKLSSKYTKV